MAQKREKSELRKLIDERGIKDLAGVQDLVKELTIGLNPGDNGRGAGR